MQPETDLEKLIPAGFRDPPPEFSVIPFWFWNDDLDEAEMLRQMHAFETHGVHGFVIHPRVGLPRHLGWMSERLLHYYRVAIEEASRRQMMVVLYDEGMYPSGSASGQVVAANPAFACRCLAKVELQPGQAPPLKSGENLVAVVQCSDRSHLAIIDRPAKSVIRGLHYVGDGPEEDEPPAADILNPEAVGTFIRLVYEAFANNFGNYFGSTIPAIFTDEPGLLGRSQERGVVPGTTGILEHVNRILGYDFTPHLPALWHEAEPEASHYRREYLRAVSLRLEETYYQPLYDWCSQHGIALTGHPAKGDDIGPLRYFHIPGQDLVWRWVLPDQPSALEGAESTQAKCSSSVMLHHDRRRNANECCGAYGHELTWDELNWLARWAFVRGVNLLFPHAFYYSIRGPRRDERPPDVGPNSPWWDLFPEYALACQRLSWVNTGSTHVCRLAILGQSDFLPWKAAKICFQHQYDFNYVEEREIVKEAVVDEAGLHLAGMTYQAVILEHQPGPQAKSVLDVMMKTGSVYHFSEASTCDGLFEWLKSRIPADVQVNPASPALRIRHVLKEGCHFYLLFNEERFPLDFKVDLVPQGDWVVIDAVSGHIEPLPIDKQVHLERHEMKILSMIY